MPENLKPMKAMVLRRPGEPLQLEWRPLPLAGPGEILVRVEACAVCRTDLHVVDGDLPDPQLPLVPGHEIVGMVESLGPEVTSLSPGMRVGIPWLGHTCGCCSYCRSGRENLCDGLYRLHAEWRLCQPCRGPCRFCFSAGRF